MNTTQADLRSWIGRSQTLHDVVTPTPVLALGAVPSTLAVTVSAAAIQVR